MILYTWENCPLCEQAKGIITNKNITLDTEQYDPTIRAHRDLHAMWVPILKTEDKVLVGQAVVDYLNNL